MKTKILKGGIKMKRKTLGIFGVLAVSLLAVSMVFAYQGDPNVQGPNHSEERHEAMQDAFDSLNYQDWYDLMTEDGRAPKITQVITIDNFDEFVAVRQAALNGDLDSLKEFRESLGLGLGQMKHGNGEALRSGQGKGQGVRCFANSE
jgi:hypothetical protein